MTVRTPLKLNGTNLQEMTSAEIDSIKNQARYLYGTDPSVDLSQVSSGGTLGTISDTRQQAGAQSTSTTAFPSEATTAEPSTVTVNYARISEAVENTTESADTNNRGFPLYQSGGNLYAMTRTDFYDTFVYPAIDTLTNGTDQPGTYRIHTATSLSGHTLVSGTPVFTDTRANTAAYTADSIPETLDQPTTITNYYLFRTNSGSAVSYTAPAYLRTDSNVQLHTTSSFDTILKNSIRHVAAEVAGSRIRYNLNGSGNNRGTGMANTKLNGTGNYQTRYVGIDDYRAQEFPNGSAVTENTYYLRINQT